MIKRIKTGEQSIAALRERFGASLHWVVGDTHGEVRTLQALMEKIEFDPGHDHVYFVGDYNAGGDPQALLRYMAAYYQADCAMPGFHLIRGNHERELHPMYPLANLPDILVIRGDVMNYFIAHAGMLTSAFELICADMAESPEQRFFAYRLSEECAEYDAPLRQIIWSRRGLYSQRSRWKNWPDEYALYRNKACIIHGHTPYCFFNERQHAFYGDKSLFWETQHIWFSEDLQAFDMDSDVKGRNHGGASYRGLSCVCLNALEAIAAEENAHLTIAAMQRAENFVFSAEYVRGSAASTGDLSRLLQARPQMKTFLLDPDRQPILADI